MDDRPRYMISVAADIVGMHPQTLRIYENKGLIRPKRTAGNTRLYSEADIERLRLIQQLTNDLGLNLAGVEQVMQLQDEVERMERPLDRMEREMREAIAGCTASTAVTSSRGNHPSTCFRRVADGTYRCQARVRNRDAVATTSASRLHAPRNVPVPGTGTKLRREAHELWTSTG